MTAKQAKEVCTHTLKPIQIHHLTSDRTKGYFRSTHMLLDENIAVKSSTNPITGQDHIDRCVSTGRYFYGTKAQCEKELLLRIAKYTGEAHG